VIETPTGALKKLVPALAVTYFMIKMALATQGLGAVLPNITEVLPDVNTDVLTNICHSIDTGFAAVDAQGVERSVGGETAAMVVKEGVAKSFEKVLMGSGGQGITDEAALETIFKMVASEERGVEVSSPVPNWWKPKNLVLVLAEHAESGLRMWVSPCRCGRATNDNDHECGEYLFRL
jgi:hypothetical protein